MSSFRRILTMASTTLVMTVVAGACASNVVVTEGTLPTVDKPFVTSTVPGATAALAATTPSVATATAAVVGGSTVAGTVAAPVDSAAATDTSAPVTVPFETVALGRVPAPTTGPPTTVAATTAATDPPSTAPPGVAAGGATCVAQSFGQGIDAGTVKLVEQALHATQNGDFNTLMADLKQWVANGPTINDKKWRQEGFKTDVPQVYFLTFFALGVACPNYMLLPGEMTVETAPYKPPVGGCISHVVPLDASAGGVFPNNDIEVVQQALYSLNLYFGAIGGTPGTATMTAIYKAVAGGFSAANPLHELSADQLAQLQISC